MRDVQDFLYRYFDEVLPYGDGTDMRVDCPFCINEVGSGDDGGHLHVSLVKETCHCFRCDYSRGWIGLVMDVTGGNYIQALGELYKVPSPAKFSSDLFGVEEVEALEVDLPDDFQLLSTCNNSRLLQRARNYLVRRGFNKYHWEKYRLGVAKSVGIRVIIPVEDSYWQGRSLLPFLKPKYVNPKAESGHVLFNSGALDLYKEVVICEGAFSAMAVGDNSVALVGKNPTKQKIRRLQDSQVDNFIVTIEKDADRSMMVLADALTGVGKRVTVWKYNEGDPADSTDYTEKPYDLRTKMEILLE